MDGLIIKISWEYFLGIMAALLYVAWYSQGRFTKIEATIGIIEKLLRNLKITSDNETARAFQSSSPVTLTDTGNQLLNESGIKEYTEKEKESLLSACDSKKNSNPYEVQQHIFDLFDGMEFPKDVDDRIKAYAYQKGVSTDIIRRVGAIYFRDLCLKEFEMKVEDIDKHDPAISSPT